MRWFAANTLRGLAALVAVGLLVLAGWQNAAYWLHVYAADPDAKLGFVSASVITDAMKVLIPAMCALYGVSLWRRGELTFIFVLCCAMSFAGGVGFQQMTKDAAGAGLRQAVDKRADLDAEIKTAEDALAKVKGAAGRPVAVIDAELLTAQAKAGRTKDGEVRCRSRYDAERDECKAVAALSVELANEKARADLGPKLTQLRKEKQALPAGQKADPMAASIGTWLRAIFGWLVVVPDEAVTRAADVVRLLFLELGPAALAVFVFSPPNLPAAPIELAAPRVRPQGQKKAAHAAAKAAILGPRGDLLELLRTANADAAGWVDSTQEAIGHAIGCSKAEANRRIKDLVARKVIEAQTGKRGTRLRLLAPAAKVVNMRP